MWAVEVFLYCHLRPYRCGRERANHSGVGVNAPTTMVCPFVCPWPWYSLKHRLVIMTVARTVGYLTFKCVENSTINSAFVLGTLQ